MSAGSTRTGRAALDHSATVRAFKPASGTMDFVDHGTSGSSEVSLTTRGVHASINGKIHAVNEACIVARKKCDDARHFCWLSSATERDAFKLPPKDLGVFPEGLPVHIGEGNSRADRVASDAFRAKFCGQAAGKVTDGSLCSVVKRQPAIASKTRHRRHI